MNSSRATLATNGQASAVATLINRTATTAQNAVSSLVRRSLSAALQQQQQDADTLFESSTESTTLALDNYNNNELFGANTATTTATTTTLGQQQLRQQTEQQATFSDWWNEYWSRQPFPSGYTQSSITLLACFISTIIFLIVVGNLLVCIAIFTEKSLKPTQNWFIASLAVSDMLLGLIVMPFSLARELMGFWIFGPLWCDIHEAVDVLLTTASINTLCLISLDRYWSITQAVKYLKKRTPRRGAFMIAFVWIFSAAVSLPPLFGWKKQNTTPSMNSSNSSANLLVSSPSPSSSSSTLDSDSRTTSAINETTSGGDDVDSFALDNEDRSQLEDSMGRANYGEPQRKRRRRRRRGTTTSSLESDTHHNHFHHQQQQHRQQQSSISDQENQYPLVGYFLANTFQHPPTENNKENNLPATPNFVQLLQAQQQQQVQSQGSPQIEYPQCQLSDDVGYVLYSAVGSFYIPCAVMVFTYIKIFLAARSRARRAINKQSRAQMAAEKAKRLASNRRTIAGAFSEQGAGGAGNNRAGRPMGDSSATTRTIATALTTSGVAEAADHNGLISVKDKNIAINQQSMNEPPMPMKVGKLVVIDRRRSMATPTSGILVCDTAKPMQQSLASSSSINKPTGPTADDHEQTGSCILTTSGVKQASSSALDGTVDDSRTTTTAITPSVDNNNNQSSMITVMSGSLAELPVTYFNFKPQVSSTSLPSEQKASTKVISTEFDDKAASLLKAIKQAATVEEDVLNEILSSASPPPNNQQQHGANEVPADTSGTTNLGTDQRESQTCDTTVQQQQQQQQVAITSQSSTNETCFMNMEEDSDNFDAQTGRTIMMVAGNAKQSANNLAATAKSQGILMTMMPPTSCTATTTTGGIGQTIVCNNVACLRRQPGVRSVVTGGGSSYCGSSINDDDEEEDDEEDGDEDEEEDDDECVDDDLLTDECNGYSGSCGLDHYCPAATSSTCVHCQCDDDVDVVIEHTDHNHHHNKHQSIEQLSAIATTNGAADSPIQCRQNCWRHDNEAGQQPQSVKHKAHHHRKHHHHHHQQQHNLRGGCEAQSLTCDDNLSSNEYRSNEEENSSIIGHDVLDATPADRSHDKKQRKSISGQLAAGDLTGSSQPPVTNLRKKSSIGQRLARLGSSVPPLSTQSGGLLALAAASQQQSIGPQAAAATTTTRNLKALRQNFFHKLNQLTAKSAMKQNKNRSPLGKSSAQSSGSSYEPSVDYATTSNVHSMMEHYHQETTFGETDEYEQPTSGDTSNTKDQVSSNEQHHNNNQGPGRSSVASGKISNNQIGFNQTNSKKSSKANAFDNQMIDYHSGKDRAYLRLRQDNSSELANKHLLSADDDSILAHSASMNGNKSLRLDLGGTLKDSGGLDSPILMKKPSSGNDRNLTLISTTGGGGGGSSNGDKPLGSGTSGRQTTTRAYLASDNERHKRKLAKARERRATLILGLIMTTFICSWLPFFTFYVLRAFCHVCRDFVSPRFEAFIFWMGYCNSAINPIIYTIFNRDFRKAFRKILFKCL